MLKKIQCEMCKCWTEQYDEHHAIPVYLDGDERDIVKVCKPCHKKADTYFNYLLMKPLFDRRKKSHAMKRYVKKYIKSKYLFGFTQEGVAISFVLKYNIRSENFSINARFQKREKIRKRTKLIFSEIQMPLKIKTNLSINLRTNKIRINDYVYYRDIFWQEKLNLFHYNIK